MKTTGEARGASQKGHRDNKLEWCWLLPQLTQLSCYRVFERTVFCLHSFWLFGCVWLSSGWQREPTPWDIHPHGAVISNPKLSLLAAEIQDNMGKKTGKVIFVEKKQWLLILLKKGGSVGDNELNEKPAFCLRELWSKQSLFSNPFEKVSVHICSSSFTLSVFLCAFWTVLNQFINQSYSLISYQLLDLFLRDCVNILL